MTLENLAKQMQQGFAGVNKRMDEGFAAVHERVDRYATATHEEITGLHTKFDEFGVELKKLDSDVSSGFADINQKLDRHDTRISGVEGVIISPHQSRSR